MKTALIILNYNNYEDTINCIESVEKYNTASIKYIVVDNGSNRSDTVDKLNAYFRMRFQENYKCIKEGEDNRLPLSYLTFLVSSTNDGYACGNNKGLNLAYADNEIDRILILNNDILFVEDIIPKLIETMDELPDCAIISPILYKKGLSEIDYNCARRNISPSELIKENFFHYWYRLKRNKYAERNVDRYILKNKQGQLPPVLPIDLPSGSCMLIQKDLFQQIGSFDPHTFLYYEENILYKKTKKLGLQNYLSTQLKCIHLGASSTSKSASLFIIDCNIHSSRHYMKHYSGCSYVTYALFYFSTLFFRISFILQKKLGIKTTD